MEQSNILNREHQLQRLGFTKNDHQRCFGLYKYEETWYVDFYKITDYKQNRWDVFIENLINDLSEVKKQYYDALREHPAYFFRAKEDKKQILDLLNKYRSWLAEETRCKMGRTLNIGRTIQLKSKIEVLKELYGKR